MTNKRPIPTEYKGTVFRSKAEAVFARTLDLSDMVFDWMYEPKVHQSHDWDFEVIVQCVEYCPTCHQKTLRRGQVLLIEYKPSEPTWTYIENLVRKVGTFVDKCPYDLSVNPPKRKSRSFADSYIVWGNPWDGPIDKNVFGPYNVLMCSYVTFPIFAIGEYLNSCPKHGWGNYEPHMDGHGGPAEDHYAYTERFPIRGVLGIEEFMAQKAREYRFDLK